MASIRPGLPSQTMSCTIGACHAWGSGGTNLSFSVDITCISKQYQVSGWLSFGFLARDQDGECDGALPNASWLSWPFWPFVSVRVWPLVWILISGSKSFRSLDLVAIDMKTVVMNWNPWYLYTNWAQKPSQDPSIYHQWTPSQMWGHFLQMERYSPSFSKHQSGNLRDGCKLLQLQTVQPDLWDPTTSFWAHPGKPENATSLGDAEWTGGLTKVAKRHVALLFQLSLPKEYNDAIDDAVGIVWHWWWQWNKRIKMACSTSC